MLRQIASMGLVLQDFGPLLFSSFKRQISYKRYINIYKKVKEILTDMSKAEWQVVMRTCFQRLEIVVFLHCLNLFIPNESTERDSSVLSHLYMIIIKKNQKMLNVLSSLHTQTYTHKCAQKTSRNEYHLLFQVGFVFLFCLFVFSSKRMEK